MGSRLGEGSYDVAIVGGAGHVGAPLGILLASKGFRTLLYDVNTEALNHLASGKMPFLEREAEALLREALKTTWLGASSDLEALTGVPVLILTIGTPIDEFSNPKVEVLTACIDELQPYLKTAQTLILRSTVAPGVTEFLDRYLRANGLECGLAFCPERVTQGYAVNEISSIPQIISATSERALRSARAVFERVAPEVIELSPTEAEFAKLICNADRYIRFAITNQFYMICEAAGINFPSLLQKMKHNYPRLGGMPRAGFAAGPCLMKDTMQLFAFEQHSFALGHIAVMINEGLPHFIVQRLRDRFDLTRTKVGILGMAFKADSDDIRESLSYKLGKILRFAGAKVLCSDEFVKDQTFVSKEQLVSVADVIIVGAPHSEYRDLIVPPGKTIVDTWGVIQPQTS